MEYWLLFQFHNFMQDKRRNLCVDREDENLYRAGKGNY